MAALACTEAAFLEEGDGYDTFAVRIGDEGYVIVQAPRPGAELLTDFFGADHYVEVDDQIFGRYGGITRIELAEDGRRVNLLLGYDVPDYGNALELLFDEPIPDDARQMIGRLGVAQA